MKRLIATLLTCIMTLCAMANGVEIGGLTYSLDSDNKCATVIASDTYAGDIMIPESVTYEGVTYSVTSIGEQAFMGSGITSVVIPNSVTKLSTSAFNSCKSLNSVTMSENLTEIGDLAFMESGITSVVIPNSVTKLSISAFNSCVSLKSVTMSKNLTEIGEGAFYKCTSLTSIEIPSGVTTIGRQTFYMCTSLTSIEIPSGVTTIGERAFYYCSSLKGIYLFRETPPELDPTTPFGGMAEGATFYVPTEEVMSEYQKDDDWKGFTYKLMEFSGESNGIKYMFDSINKEARVVSKDDGYSGDVVIPASLVYGDNTYDVTSISESAFFNCTSLTSITIPSSVISIGSSAFSYCTSLTSITLPSNVSSIGVAAFNSCDKLTKMYIMAEEPPKSEGSLFSNDVTVYVPSATAYDAYVAAEGWEGVAFSYLIEAGINGLTYSLDFLSKCATVITSDTYADVTGVEVPASVIYNDDEYQVTAIGDNAFQNCTALTTVTIGESVTAIGDNAFNDCEALTTVYLLPVNPPTLGGGAFDDVSEGALLKVPTLDILNVYRNDESWKDYVDMLKYYFDYATIDGVNYDIDPRTLQATVASDVETPYSGEVVVPQYVTYNGESYEVTSIGDNAFQGCTGLLKVYILTKKCIPCSEGAFSEKNCSIEFYVSSVEDYNADEVYSKPTLKSISEISDITSAKVWQVAKEYNLFGTSGKSLNLMADIELSQDVCDVTLGEGVTFNGNGHTITLSNPSVPLFSSVASDAALHNLLVTTSYGGTSGNLSSGEDTYPYGMLTRYNYGEIESCAAEVYCNINVNASQMGLLVGSNNGSINNCYAILAKDCSFSDAVTSGGLVGAMAGGTLSNCYVHIESGASYPMGMLATVGSKSADATASNLYYYCGGAEMSDDVGKQMMSDEGDIVYTTAQFIALFDNPAKWLLTAQEIGIWPGTPKLSFMSIDAEYDDEILVADVELTSKEDVDDFVEVLKNNPEVFETAIVRLSADVDFGSQEESFDTENIATMKRMGTASQPFRGTFDGAGHAIKNMTVNSDAEGSGAFFGVLSEEATVRNVHFENVEVRVNTLADEYMEYDTIYIGVFADKLEGKMSNVSFVGNILVEETLAAGKQVKLCFASDGAGKGEISHAFIYEPNNVSETQGDTEGNKVCIVIKQHIGVGRKMERVRKTCTNRKSNKALVLEPDLDVNDEAAATATSEYREFTDDEFARGDVAYWLNYAGVGYTGEYFAEWKQGELYPIYEENTATPLVNVVYTIEGVEDIDEVGFNAPMYSNVGDCIAMSYSEKPDEILVEGKSVAASSVGALSTQISVPTPDLKAEKPRVNVTVRYNKSATPLAERETAQQSVTAEGNTVSIRGAEGAEVVIVTLRGEEIYRATAGNDYTEVIVPQSGIYVVTVGDKSTKVVCR